MSARKPQRRQYARSAIRPSLTGQPAGRLRSRREHQALEYLRNHPRCTALDIGAAAVQGEPRASAMSWKGKQDLGLELVTGLFNRGLIAASPGNRFTLV